MKKHVIMALCGLTAAMLVTSGYAPKTENPLTPPAATITAGAMNKGTVTRLGAYKGLELTMWSTQVTEGELQAEIQSILDANPEYIKVTDRTAQNGDVVCIDYTGIMDGEPLDGGSAENFRLHLGSGSFIDGFEDGLIGSGIGEQRSLNLTFPQNYSNQDLAGQSVIFIVTVNGIEEIREAVLDNDFVEKFSNFKTVDEWKADIRANLETRKKAAAEAQSTAEAFLVVIENSEYELNEAAVAAQYDRLLNYYNSIAQMSDMSLSDVLSFYGMTEYQFQAELRHTSEYTVAQQLLVEAIAQAEGLKVEHGDMESLAAQYNVPEDYLKSQQGAEHLEQMVIMDKVSRLIRDSAVAK